MNITKSSWDVSTGVLTTELKGTVTVEHVRQWIEGLHRELGRIPNGHTFKHLCDLHGYEPADIDAHKAMRLVVPQVLASHGLRPAYIDLFDEKPEMEITVERGIMCTGFANVHHEESKMNNYETKIAKPNQRFFTSRRTAEDWLAKLP
jgi:hypothetical protein